MVRYALRICFTLVLVVAGVSDVAGQTVLSIAVAPPVSNPTGNVKVGATEQLTATATMSNGTTQDVTALAVWGTLDPTIATVSNAPGSQGLVSGVQQGKTSVYATYSGVVSGTTIPAGITSLTLSPPKAFVAATCIPTRTCSAIPFTATGKFDDGTTVDLTNTAVWMSSNTKVATVDNSGVAMPLRAGSAIVTATVVTIQATAVVTVWAAGGGIMRR